MIPKKSLFAIADTLEGVPILGVVAGTPAARAGLRYGDVLLSVNGQRTRTIADYIEAKNADPTAMEIVVFRGGEALAHKLTYDSPAAPVDTVALLAELVTLRLIDPGEAEPRGHGGTS